MALRRLLIVACAIVFVDTAFYSVVAPLLPGYAKDLGLSKASAGILAAAFPAGTLIGSLPAGVLASRASPKATLMLGMVLLAVASPVFGFGHHVVLLDAARFLQGVGGACSWAGVLAWLVAAAPADRRGAMIGTAVGTAVAGSLLGPVIGLIARAASPEVVFGSVPLVVIGLLALTVRLPSDHQPVAQGVGDAWAAMRLPAVRTGMWLVALPSLGQGALISLGSLRLDALGGGAVLVGATFLAGAAVEAALSPVVGRVSDDRGRLAPIRIGLAGAVGVLAIITLPTGVGLAAAVIVAGVGAFGLFFVPAIALVSDATEAAGLDQGLGFALVNLAWAGGTAGGAAGGAALGQAVGDAVPFGVIGVLCAATLVTVARRHRAPVLAA